MKLKTIKQKVVFKATSHEVYEALMDSKKHSNFTESKAEISREVGGKINAYDGYIAGKNLELVQDKKIVQEWRGKDWPKNHYSKAIFLLKKNKNGALLEFTQEGVPEDNYKSIKQGWHDHYWNPMKNMLEK